MLKAGFHQPCLASALPAGCEAGGPSSVCSVSHEVDSASVSLGKQPKKTISAMVTLFHNNLGEIVLPKLELITSSSQLP